MVPLLYIDSLKKSLTVPPGVFHLKVFTPSEKVLMSEKSLCRPFDSLTSDTTEKGVSSPVYSGLVSHFVVGFPRPYRFGTHLGAPSPVSETRQSIVLGISMEIKTRDSDRVYPTELQASIIF